MAPSFPLNTFKMGPVLGMQDLNMAKGSVISGLLDTSYNSATNVAAGTAMKLVTTSSGIPKVVPITSDSDAVFAIALYSVKNGYYNNTINNGAMELGMKDTVVYMNAGGAIAAGQGVSIVSATPGNVIAQAGAASRIGYALDAATGINQLVRVYLEVPAAASIGASRTVAVTATLAEINAGKVLIPGAAGKQITVTNFIERVVGNFATGTSVRLQSDATAVIVETTAEAGLTDGAVLIPGSANVTLGAGFGAPLPVGEGLKVANVGAAQTGGTSITFDVTYTQA